MMSMSVIFLVGCFGFFILVAGALMLFAVRIIPADKRLAVYRLGQYLGDKGPGLVFLLPFIDRGVLKDVGTAEPTANVEPH